jgi:DNA (cytosine-5)-methyltransferase 1
MANKNKKIKAVSLFAGCGGLDLGFTQEGFDIIWANDYDHWACETYKRNFGAHVVEGDITALDLKKIPRADIILGGFPCQDFSMLWKRGGINADRGNLYRYFVNIVKASEPKMFIAENVRGLLSANGGNAIKQIVADFAKTGKHGFDVEVHPINFANYGAAQLRERVLIVGVNKKYGKKFKLPEPTRNEKNWMTAKEALKGVEKASHNNEHQNITPKTREMLKLIPAGGNFASIPKNHRLYVKGMISHVYRRLDPERPSTTIIAGGGGGTWGYHFKEPRPLTNRERARLFGYPDNFVFEGSITEVRRQIGNSVPPVGIRPIANAVQKFVKQLT